MSAKTNSLIQAWLDHYFLNQPIALLGDAGGLLGSVSPGALFLSLHDIYPGKTGNQATNELAYTSYVRVAVDRTGARWARSGNIVRNVIDEQWPICTGGSGVARFIGVGRSLTGPGVLDYTAPLGVELGEGAAFHASDVFTIPQLSGLALNEEVVFLALTKGPFPGGLVPGDVYFVKTLAGDNITLSSTAGGATIDITSPGVGLAYKLQKLQITNLIRPVVFANQFAAREN